MTADSPTDDEHTPRASLAAGFIPGYPTNVRRTVFLLGFGTSWMLYLHRYTFALIKPKLAEEWGVGKDELGILDSVFSTCYTTAQLPLGVLGDLAGAHLVLTVLILVWSIGLAMHALAPSTTMLWWARATLGVGQSAVFAALNRVTRTWFPTSTRATVQGFIGVFAGRFGGLSANLLFGFLLVGYFEIPWRMAIYIFAGMGIAQALAFATLFRNSPRRHPRTNAAEVALITGETSSETEAPSTKPAKLERREMLQRMSPRSILNLVALNIQSILSTVADNIYSNWIPLFLAEVHALKFQEMGLYSSLPLLGGALGGALGGWLNDTILKQTGNRRWTRTGIALTGKGLAGVVLLVALLTTYDNPYVFCSMLFLVKFFGDWSLTTSWATISDIGGKATATVFALNNSIAGIGAILAPLMYGYVAEYSDWKTVFFIACGAYFLCALSWLLVNCTIPILRDETPILRDETH